MVLEGQTVYSGIKLLAAQFVLTTHVVTGYNTNHESSQKNINYLSTPFLLSPGTTEYWVCCLTKHPKVRNAFQVDHTTNPQRMGLPSAMITAPVASQQQNLALLYQG